jgi:hypothetical protein
MMKPNKYPEKNQPGMMKPLGFSKTKPQALDNEPRGSSHTKSLGMMDHMDPPDRMESVMMKPHESSESKPNLGY